MGFYISIISPRPLRLHCINNHAMASATPVMHLCRRTLIGPAPPIRPLSIRTFSYFPPARRRWLLQQPRHNILPLSQRTISTSPQRRFAAVDDAFDPRQQERESDQVDVCIVGGGTTHLLPPPQFLSLHRVLTPPQALLASAPQSASSSWLTKPVTKISEYCC